VYIQVSLEDLELRFLVSWQVAYLGLRSEVEDHLYRTVFLFLSVAVGLRKVHFPEMHTCKVALFPSKSTCTLLCQDKNLRHPL
jgi:hypothetical protein